MYHWNMHIYSYTSMSSFTDCTTWSLNDLVGRIEDQNPQDRRKDETRACTYVKTKSYNFEVMYHLFIFFGVANIIHFFFFGLKLYILSESLFFVLCK